MTQAQSLIENISLVRQATTPEEGDPEAAEGETPASEESEEAEADGPIYQFTILVPENDALIAIANDYAQRWAAINLDVNVESAPEDVYQQRLNDGDFDAVITQLPLNADPDVYAYWHVGQAPDGLNYGAVADDRVSELLERARRDANGMNRIALYHDFQRLFVERAIAIPLYHPLYTYAVSTNVENVQLGFIGTPEDRFRTLADWQLR
jgi:peptide/nickel transport system substrate-binding protein